MDLQLASWTTLCVLRQVGLVQLAEVGESGKSTIGDGGDRLAADVAAMFGGNVCKWLVRQNHKCGDLDARVGK